MKETYSIGDTIIIGKTISVGAPVNSIIIRKGTKGLVQFIYEDGMLRLFFRNKKLKLPYWGAQDWKPYTTRMVLTEKTIPTFGMNTKELVEYLLSKPIKRNR
jgi:hypothetical protein